MVQTILRGMTWDHPRGYDPLARGAAGFAARYPGLTIEWDKRSLREFGEAPLEDYAGIYDLIVIDHPFVGFAAAHPYLVDWATALSDAEKADFAADSVGQSWPSYEYMGGIWALPLDAATQVSSCRPDLLERLGAEIPTTFEDVITLGRRARTKGQWITTTAFPTDAISTVISIAANLGHPIVDETETFLPPSLGREVMSRFHALVDVSHPKATAMNPIHAYEAMVSGDDIVYCAYAYGYTNYARANDRPRLKFANAPAHSERGPAGTQLGGTGIAVSALSKNRDTAIAYAKWLAGKEHQTGDYVAFGGQPASLAAWTDADNDALCGGFFSDTLATLESAHVRPRFDGWIPVFEHFGERITACLRGEIADSILIDELNTQFAAAQRKAGIGRGQ
ncbi:ABC transporter substrate-binding protein [Chelatococcus asaccharovorans]|uniref:ABC transporter substrate-binding protein n=1 Tax=Chelatococcus asaccharovorans TaxID=28210 RepID=UPI00224C7741|nr:extracellular solute-binding protein [Chelatococcus asaccharovorans]CAH1655305.1 Carbohydrate ABC transporter substrate-binding protein (CUT1 family) [Chelatococcus asaccharovorans]CAH1685467.1 Carbohydrate ABC transporter substrate-binding protein (CUT1 family) [Chelatococcus asaccharovorans]